MAEFEEAYTREVLPSLNGLGFQASAEPRRTTVDSVFSRLFEFESPLEMTRKIGKTQEEGELQKDVQWRQAMLALGSTFGIRHSAVGWPDPAQVHQLSIAGGAG